MTDRREFLKRAGMIFCSCGLAVPAHAQTPRTARAPVMIDGKRVRTIDTHAHCYFHESLKLMGDDWEKLLPPVKGVKEHFLSQKEVLDQRFAAMEAQGIDMQVLNTNPFWYGAPREQADQICKAQYARQIPNNSRRSRPCRCSFPTSRSSISKRRSRNRD
jgi:hypothetical protein